MGKTTIGRVIALGQIEKGWTAYECRTPDEILDSYKKEIPQVFVADDFFGRTEYEPQRVSQWQSELTHILPKLDKDHWLILTCRAHLLEMGKSRLDVAEYSDKFPDIGEVIVNAGRLDEIEKAKILYRHAKNANLTHSAKKIIRNNAQRIIWSQHYTPERIRRLVNQNLLDLKNLNENEIQKILMSSLSEPTKQMETSFKTLDGGHRWSLYALLSSDKNTSNEQSYEMICPENIQLSSEEAFTPLTEAFITKETDGLAGPVQQNHYSWIHPSCRDLAIKLLTSKVSDRRQFLKTCSLRGLVLACSVGGGSEGDLNLPFLLSKEDWNIFTKRLYSHLKRVPSDFYLIWNNYKELTSIDGEKVKLQEFRNCLEELSDICPSEFNDLNHRHLERLNPLARVLEHYKKMIELEAQWQTSIKALIELSEDESLAQDEISYELEASCDFAEFADSLEKGDNKHKYGVQLVELVIKSCFEDSWLYQTLGEDVDSETEAETRYRIRDDVVRCLGKLKDCSWVTEQQFNEIEELIIYYDDLIIDFQDKDEDEEESGRYVKPEYKSIYADIGSIFSDL